ncbi:MAG TPA: molybdopterin cofactor-binding domain-containing protein [Drouetiella sp.]|jgi:xanthine dehydrogenase/oxidase
MKELTVVSPKNSLVDESYSHELIFWLNGEKVEILNPDPTVSLSDYLHEIGLTGTKVGCGQGGCGACTVMLSHRDRKTGEAVHRPINSCLKPLCAVDGCVVTTTEGIGNVHDGLDPAQHCIAMNNGTQCGFCTPGFVMNTHAYLQQHPEAKVEDLEKIFGGNLCRCTGYRPILTGVRTLACDYEASCDKSQKCLVDPSFEVKVRDDLAKIDLDKTPAFDLPPRLVHFFGKGRDWYRPNTLQEVMRIKKAGTEQSGRGSVRLVFGNTASGIYPNEKPRIFIDISRIDELTALTETESGITVGASTPIQDLLEFADRVAKKVGHDKGKGLEALVYHGQFIAGLQVRSAGSVAGNIFITRDHASQGGAFPSDLFTAMATLGTKVTIASEKYGGQKQFLLIDMPPTEQLPEDAIIVSFEIPFTDKSEYVQTYRIARRPQMAHPIVNAGFRIRLNADGTVEPGQVTIIYGGLATMIHRAVKFEEKFYGKAWNAETLNAVLPELQKEVKEITVTMDEEGLTNEYRMQLAETFFYKFYLHVANELDPRALKPELVSAANHDIRALSHGVQEYTEYPEMFPLTQPIIKQAAFVQASGEIRYVQDVALPTNGLHAAMVKSTRPHAKFTFTKNTQGLEPLKELLRKQFPGFKELITREDVPECGTNLVGLGDDDPVFSDGVVTSVGAPIALALAETIQCAREAAEFVEKECIAYEDLPAVITLADAVKADTAMPMILKSADPDEDINQRIPTIEREGSNQDWLNDPLKPMPGTSVATGIIRTPATAHFYLETNCALAIPGPYNRMTVHSSTQNPNGTQSTVARALGVSLNQINVMIEQIGGGFGGKQHRANIVAAQAAVAAYKLNRPVRLLFDRATDMQMIGKHHPYEADYYVAYRDDGKIEGMRLDFRNDAGDTYDCSFAVLDLSLLTADGCYMIDTLQANGTCYRTNKTSNTAFRTFGVAQMWTILESVIERVAFELTRKLGRTVRPEEIREKNMYRDGTPKEHDKTHFGQELDFLNIREIWNELKKTSDFEKRADAVAEFNKKNRWRKRGIVMMPQKHGIAFTEPRGSLNSASALINVNMADGSVMIHHGAVEMGQGIHTKIGQLAANVLGIPLELIHVNGNNSDVITNCPATAASTGFDLNGGAVEKACKVLRTRLEEFCVTMEQYLPHERIEDWRTNWGEKWKEIVFKAWYHRVNLAAAELYKTPHYKGPSNRNPKGKPFLYFSLGATVIEVEIDVLTGEFKIPRADVVMDGCKSPNAAIDIGQLEGGYVQGIGMATTEELVYDHDGRLVTDNIWSYKPPCTKTIPIDFRARLHPVNEERNSQERLAEKQAIKSTKAFTESSLTLGCAVYFALIHAIKDARKEQLGTNEWIDMDLPLTCQRIQQLCAVKSENLKL